LGGSCERYCVGIEPPIVSDVSHGALELLERPVLLLVPRLGHEVFEGEVVGWLRPGVEVKTSLYDATTAVTCGGILSKEVGALVFVINVRRCARKSYRLGRAEWQKSYVFQMNCVVALPALEVS
jgi:hypothetical protein